MSNRYVSEFLLQLRSRYAHDKADMTVADWIVKNTKLNGRPFSFAQYPFQRAIADDMHPNMDVIKPSQVGMTEIQIRKVLAWLMRNSGLTAIYTMPNDDMFKRVAQGRILPLIQKEEVFQPRPGEKQVRSRSIIQLRDSWLYLTGASEGDATSIAADFVANDEVDLTDQEILALYQSRLQNSLYKINQRFSTPTFNGYGIDLGYQSSDQRQFLLKCDSCNHWQRPDFTLPFLHIPDLPDHIEDPCDIDEKIAESLNLPNIYVKCERCNSPLDLGREDNREWVAKHPSRTHARGYEILPFSTNRLPPSYIITQLLNYRRRDAIRRFYNTVLGRAYTGADERLTEAEIRKVMVGGAVPKIGSDTPVYIGIDLGLTCHLILGTPAPKGGLRVFYMAAVPYQRIVEVVRELLSIYKILAGAIDRLPYTPTANEIRMISQNRIMPVQYTGSKTVNVMFTPEKVPDYAQINRTNAIDRVFNMIRRNQIELAGYTMYEAILIDHLRDMVREEEPEKEAVWKKLTGQDHFFHALTYMAVAARVRDVSILLDKNEYRDSVLLDRTRYADANEGALLLRKKYGILPPAGPLG